MSRSNISSQDAYQSTFSLPDLINETTRDDLRKTQDRKMKKRIQNREAQRTYRSRMKARLEELEARLASEDGQATQSIDEAPTHSRSTRTLSRSPSSAMDDILPSVMVSPQQLLPNETSQPLVSPSGDQRRTNDESTNSFPTHDEFSAQSIEYEDRLSPSFGAMRSNTRSRSKELLLNILSSQSELINNLDQFQQEIEETEDVDQSNKDATILPILGWSELPHIDPTFLPMNCQTSLTFPAHQDPESWVQGPSISHIGEASLLNDSLTPQSIASRDSQMRTKALDLDPDRFEFMNRPSKRLSRGEQFESILEHTAELGFEHFDWVAVSYYIHKFDKSSFVANEQRMSRTRRLPAVLAQLFSATASWSEWERRGVYEEIIKVTESLLLSETSASQSALDEKLLPLVDGCIKDQLPFTSASASMRGEIESSLPNLWTLIMALTQGNRGVKPNERSKLAMATVLLLRFAGRMRKHQLLNLLGAFLV